MAAWIMAAEADRKNEAQQAVKTNTPRIGGANPMPVSAAAKPQITKAAE